MANHAYELDFNTSLVFSIADFQFDFLGRVVYMSDVYEILKKGLKYLPKTEIDPSERYRMRIRADTFYCGKEVTCYFFGIKSHYPEKVSTLHFKHATATRFGHNDTVFSLNFSNAAIFKFRENMSKNRFREIS